MNKNRKTSHILNVFQYDETTGAVTLPSTLVLTAPASNDNSTKVSTTAWVRTYVSGLSYLTGNQSITVSGDATGSGTTAITLTLANTAVTPGTYGSTTLVPVVTVDSKGRITSVTTAAISGSLTFTGDVTGSGTTGTSTGLTLAASGVTAGTYTKVTVDSKGRVTVGANASTTDISEGTNLYYTDTRVGTYLTANSYATQSYVGTQVANLVAAAPATLDTLNELAAALGNDPSFATTVSTSIGTKVPQTRTLTINGTGYDLSADRSWTINSMVYPGAGIALSTGTAWGTSITDNSANWNTAYGWGNHASGGYLTGITSSQVTTALGYTPYNSTNPSGYITGITSSNVTTALGYTPYNSTNPNGYITGITSGNVTTALGYTPYNSTNPSGYITGINSSAVTTALGFTPLSSSGSVTINGDLTVGVGNSSNIYMNDGDEGQRQIHCNSNRIGFLTQAGAWGAYCDDSGNWAAANFSGSSSGTNTGDQTNVSGTASNITAYTINQSVGTGNSPSFAGLIINTGGTGTWGPFVVTSTSQWGDGATQYVTIGAGGAAGIMINNPHIVWNTSETAAGMKFGRSGGISSGSYYNIGTGASNNFFINKDGAIASPILNINSSGNTTFSGTISASNLSGTNTGDQTNISGNAATATTATNALEMANNGNSISGMGSISNWDSRPGVGFAAYGINNHTGVTLSGYGGYGGVRLYASGYPTHASSVLRLEASDSVKTFGGLYSDGNPVLVQNTSISYSFGLNDTKLYLRTNGDNNHYLWNNASDFEEMVYYNGTGFKVTSSTGVANCLFESVASSGMLFIGSVDAGRTYIGDASRSGIAIGGTAYPQLMLNAVGGGNTTHGANISMTGLKSAGGYRRWVMGIPNLDPTTFSLGWADDQSNPHYGVGVGWGASAAKFSWDTSGNFIASGDITAYGTPSDLRLKDLKGKVSNALSSIIKLNGYRFDWKEDKSKLFVLKEDIGVIAQEVADVFPELARTNEDGFMSVRYQGLTAVLIEAIKEQQLQIEELKNKLDGLTR